MEFASGYRLPNLNLGFGSRFWEANQTSHSYRLPVDFQSVPHSVYNTLQSQRIVRRLIFRSRRVSQRDCNKPSVYISGFQRRRREKASRISFSSVIQRETARLIQVPSAVPSFRASARIKHEKEQRENYGTFDRVNLRLGGRQSVLPSTVLVGPEDRHSTTTSCEDCKSRR